MFDQEGNDLNIHQLMNLRHRAISQEQMQRFEGYIAEIFTALGLDLNNSATKETPRRFLQALYEATDGYEGDTNVLTTFETECSGNRNSHPGQVIEGPIPFVALCEHHGLPFYGSAYIGYVPQEHIIGLSKLTRLVRVYARRFSVQERLGEQIVTAFAAMLQPYGVAVSLEAHHLCVQMRGVHEMSTLTRTTLWRGEYERDASLRVEFLLACGADQ